MEKHFKLLFSRRKMWRCLLRIACGLPNTSLTLRSKTSCNKALNITARHVSLTKGAIHSTKISGNFGLKLNGSVQSNRKSFEKSGPPLEVDPFFGWTGPIEMDCSIWPFRPILNSRTSLFGIFHVQNGGKYLSLRFYGLLTADLSVLLAHPCTVTTGL